MYDCNLSSAPFCLFGHILYPPLPYLCQQPLPLLLFSSFNEHNTLRLFYQPISHSPFVTRFIPSSPLFYQHSLLLIFFFFSIQNHFYLCSVYQYLHFLQRHPFFIYLFLLFHQQQLPALLFFHTHYQFFLRFSYLWLIFVIHFPLSVFYTYIEKNRKSIETRYLVRFLHRITLEDKSPESLKGLFCIVEILLEILQLSKTLAYTLSGTHKSVWSQNKNIVV